MHRHTVLKRLLKYVTCIQASLLQVRAVLKKRLFMKCLIELGGKVLYI